MQQLVRRRSFGFSEHGLTEGYRTAPAPPPEKQLRAEQIDEDPDEDETPDLVELFARGGRRG